MEEFCRGSKRFEHFVPLNAGRKTTKTDFLLVDLISLGPNCTGNLTNFRKNTKINKKKYLLKHTNFTSKTTPSQYFFSNTQTNPCTLAGPGFQTHRVDGLLGTSETGGPTEARAKRKAEAAKLAEAKERGRRERRGRVFAFFFFGFLVKSFFLFCVFSWLRANLSGDFI